MKNAAKWILGIFLAVVLVAISAEVLAAPSEKKAREYAGGADEDDLKVQTELPVPPVKVDRKSIEQKVLSGVLKKSGSTAVVPESSDSSSKNSEEE